MLRRILIVFCLSFFAACSGDGTSGGVDNRITISGDQGSAEVAGSERSTAYTIARASNLGAFAAGGGRDKIIIEESATSSIDAGADNDSILLRDSNVIGDINGGAGEDVIVLDSGIIIGSVDGGAGDDVINVYSFVTIIRDDDLGASGDVLGGAGEDALTIESTEIYGAIDGGGEDDTITLRQGIYTLYDGGAPSPSPLAVYGGEGADTLILDDARISGNVTGDDEIDTISVIGGGAVDGNISGGGGGDDISLNDGRVAGDVSGDAGMDFITLTSAEVGGDISGGEDDDSFIMHSGTARGDVSTDAGEDSIFVEAGTIEGDILGGSEDDEIRVLEGTLGLYDEDDEYISGGNVDGGAGNDDIEVSSGTFAGYSGGAALNPFTAGERNVYGGAGDDTFVITPFTSTPVMIEERVIGSDDVDTFDFSGVVIAAGTLDADIVAISGGAGDDVFRLTTDVSVGDLDADDGRHVEGGDGSDTIDISGMEASGGLYGDNADGTACTGADNCDDTITIVSGEMDFVDGGEGDDTIDFTGSDITLNGYVAGGDGSDTINIDGTEASGGIYGDHEDTAICTGAGNCDDIITVAGDEVEFIHGGEGDDTITLTDDIVFSGDCDDGTTEEEHICGGDGTDTLEYADGVDPLADVNVDVDAVVCLDANDAPLAACPSTSSLRVGLLATGFEKIVLAPRLQLLAAFSSALNFTGEDLARGLAEHKTHGRIWQRTAHLQGEKTGIIQLDGAPGAQGRGQYQQDISLVQQGFFRAPAQGLTSSAAIHRLEGTLRSAENGFYLMEISGFGGGAHFGWHSGQLAAGLTMLGTWFDAQAKERGADKGSISGAQFTAAASLRWTLPLYDGLTFTPQAETFWHKNLLDATGSARFDNETITSGKAGATLNAGRHKLAFWLSRTADAPASGGYFRQTFQPETEWQIQWHSVLARSGGAVLRADAQWRRGLVSEKTAARFGIALDYPF